ncbi:unnamed protein product [Rotaria magnacalcarata]|nr:unnamed protein product [Rotaria magnacalcarata]CAF4364183.1 unnamed protein product [Rotaria magnacalcarata]
MDRVENDLKHFIQQYETLKDNFIGELDSIERDITNIEKYIQTKPKRVEVVDTINQLNHIQVRLDNVLNDCRTLSLPYEQIRIALERIDQSNLRVDKLHVQLSPPPPSSIVMKSSSPTSTRILGPSTVTTINGHHHHHSSKKQGRSNQSSDFFTNSPTGIEQLDVIVTGDYRRSSDNQQQQQQQQQQQHTRSNMMIVDSGHINNETKPFVLVDELSLINKNINTLSQLLEQRLSRLLQAGLPTSHDDLLLLYQEHKVR